MPFRCPYCGGQFCSAHRLPENHACPRLAHAREERQQSVLKPEAYNSYNYSYVYGQQQFKRQYRIHFSQKEVKHIAVAAALVVGIGFSIGLYGNIFGGFRFVWTWDLMAIFAAIMCVSFLTHEIGHKVMAQRKGMWAEFRLTLFGSILTLVSVFIPVRMIAPGAMMIGGSVPSAKDILKISVAGPITNLVFAGVFFSAAFGLPLPLNFALMLIFAGYINAFMALFNLIPFGILDGYKIFSVNKGIWVAMFVPSVILTIFGFLF